MSFLGYIENELSKLSIRNKIDKITQKDSIISENRILNIAQLKFNDLTLVQVLDVFENFNSTGYIIKIIFFEIKKMPNGRFSTIIELQALSTKQ